MADQFTSWQGDPNQGAVPADVQNDLVDLANTFNLLVGGQAGFNDTDYLAMANAGVTSTYAMGQWLKNTENWAPFQKFPWAQYGLSQDQYQSLSTSFSTEYTKVTGQTMTDAQLTAAFQSNIGTFGGGILSGSQYAQQLMNDANIQKTYGWVKYGMDYSQWQQQKLQMRGEFGRDIQDPEAATLLQYTKPASGGAMVTGPKPQQQQTAGAGASVVR